MGFLSRQHKYGDGLRHELNQDADGHQPLNDVAQPKQRAEHHRDGAHRQQGDVGDVLGGMEAAEDAEEAAVERGGVGNARVAQHQRPHRGEGRHQNQQRDDLPGQRAVQLLDEGGNDVAVALRFLPGNHADDSDVHHKIDGGDAENRIDDGAGNDAHRVLDLPAQVADVLVAQVVVDGEGGGAAQPHPEHPLAQVEGAGRESEHVGEIEIRDAAVDDPGDGAHHHHPEVNGNFPDGGDAPVEQKDDEHADRGRQNPVIEVAPAVGRRQLREEILGVGGKTDQPAGHGERRAEDHLPNEQEAQQPSPAAWAEGLPQKDVSPARVRHGCAELRPDHSVRKGQQRAQHPAQHRLRPAHLGQDERDGDEGPDAHHVDHVERGGLFQAQSAHQLLFGLRGGLLGFGRTVGHGCPPWFCGKAPSIAAAACQSKRKMRSRCAESAKLVSCKAKGMS